MKIYSKVIIALASSILVMAVANAAANIKCPVAGGTVRPGEKIVINIDNLPGSTKEAWYNLTCDINTPNYSKKPSVVAKIWATKGGIVYVDGNTISRTHGQVALDKCASKLFVSEMSVTRKQDGTIDGAQVTIENMDYADSFTANNCFVSYVS